MASGSSASGGDTASPAQLAADIEAYLAEHPEAVVLEDGAILFDMRLASCSVAESHGRCVLQFWSEERNLVRSVLSAQRRATCLRLMTRRMGAAKPVALEIVPNANRRTPAARETSRKQYMRRLERVLARVFPEWKAEGFRTATDLEHSFGPAYVRGHLVRGSKGMQAEAVIGVGADESSAMVDGILTLGLLWLDHCRERSQGKQRHYGALDVIVPVGAAQTTAERMVWLNHEMASFRLFTLDERSEELVEIDYRDVGNVNSRLVHTFDVVRALERAQADVNRVLELVPEAAHGVVEIRPRSAAEVGLFLHGLEFARVRGRAATNSFTREQEITFGAGPNETPLNEDTEPMCRELLAQLFLSRQPDGEHIDPLFRVQPERWLESRIRMTLKDFLPGLRGEFLYSQVPAIGSGERGMLDLLTVDRDGRLVVIEVKANEDLHLPLQGLDYWLRVRALNADRRIQGTRETGAFERHGYFAGTEVVAQPPKLLLIAPALRIHPSNETVLRYFSPEVEWELVAVGEYWRRELKTIFRKRGN